MKVLYSDHASYPLPPGHHFPAEKYQLLRHALIDQYIISEFDLIKAEPASKASILLAHTGEYYHSVLNGMSAKQTRLLGLPWSKDLIVRAHVGIGGVIEASKLALESSIAGSLSGGTHHAFAGEGRGFCLFNDTAVAILYLLKNQLVQKCAVVDLDAHQGNGTSSILGQNEQVFILDMFGKDVYPVRKVPSSLDIPISVDISDEEYLELLEKAFPHVVSTKPEIIFFIAGVDPLQGDRFGRLNISSNALMQRDQFIFESCKHYGIPVVITMGGGYTSPIEQTVQAHLNTYKAARQIFG